MQAEICMPAGMINNLFFYGALFGKLGLFHDSEYLQEKNGLFLDMYKKK
jgi:hypothetical protein